MAFGIESAIDPELLRQLQVGVSGFVLVMVLIMFHNVTSKLEKKPTDEEIKDKIRKKLSKKLRNKKK